MKAIEFLKWLVENSISTESMGFVTIDKDFDFEKFFGNTPLWSVEPGEYLWMYSDDVNSVDIESLKKIYLSRESWGMPAIINTGEPDRRNGGVTAILLFKFEENNHGNETEAR